MNELTRLGTATAPQLDHVLNDRMRLTCALRGLRARGYAELERRAGRDNWLYHAIDVYPDDDLDLPLCTGR